MIQIPTLDFPAYTETLILDEQSFLLQFVWNTRLEAWQLSILDVEENPILMGLKLVLNWAHFPQYRALNIPPGELFVIDPDPNNHDKIGRDDFVNDRKLEILYAEEAEL